MMVYDIVIPTPFLKIQIKILRKVNSYMILKQNEKYNEPIRYVDNLDAIFDILLHSLYFDVDCEMNDHIFPLTYKNHKIVIGDIDDEPLKTHDETDDIASWYVDMSEVDNEENLHQLIAKMNSYL